MLNGQVVCVVSPQVRMRSMMTLVAR